MIGVYAVTGIIQLSALRTLVRPDFSIVPTTGNQEASTTNSSSADPTILFHLIVGFYI